MVDGDSNIEEINSFSDVYRLYSYYFFKLNYQFIHTKSKNM